jgi:hypothetical protein
VFENKALGRIFKPERERERERERRIGIFIICILFTEYYFSAGNRRSKVIDLKLVTRWKQQ